MYTSLDWINELVSLETVQLNDLIDKLTLGGFEVEETFVSVNVFFDIMTNRDNNTIVDGIPDGLGGILPTANTMTININGEETIVSVIDANVNYPSVNFDNGKYSFNISL